MSQRNYHFWYVDKNNTASIISGANREAANAKFRAMHEGNIILSVPARICTHCNAFSAVPYAEKVQYADGIMVCSNPTHGAHI